MEDGLADNAQERKKQITILCSSTQTYEPYSPKAQEAGAESVMVFPDYKVSRFYAYPEQTAEVSFISFWRTFLRHPRML